MILFDPEQSEAVEAFPGLHAAGAKMPGRPTLRRYLREAQRAVGLNGDVTVLLTTDDGIRGLNRRFRKKNKATDVLSFPAGPDMKGVPGFGVAGDLAISVETAARQAAEQGHRLSVELRVLMLHGLLHLAGMDHEIDDGKMARKERRLRAQLGLPMGLIERVEIPSGAKAPARRAGLMYGLKPVPSVQSNSAVSARLKPRPFKQNAAPAKSTARVARAAKVAETAAVAKTRGAR